MSFPTNLTELRNAGYLPGNAAHCRGCNARIEWWKTPNGKSIPIDVKDDGTITAHFATCPKAQNYRK